ncbi:hypothetical protein PV-S19_0150 [Pacmanvirus S19]|nr:hypothetical protein PV-S19_0150 [Pacmanvirus S19]
MSSNKYPECPKGHKDCEISCAAYFQGRKQEAQLSLTVEDFTSDDIHHLYECHKVQFGMWSKERILTLESDVTYFENECNKYKAALAKERAENAALRVKLEELNKKPAAKPVASAQPAGKSVKLIVNPRNHVDGFCDALIKNGKANYKCTATAEYEQRFCILHIEDHEAAIEVPTAVAVPKKAKKAKEQTADVEVKIA